MAQAVTKVICNIADMMIQKTEILVVLSFLFAGYMTTIKKKTATVTNSASHLVKNLWQVYTLLKVHFNSPQ